VNPNRAQNEETGAVIECVANVSEGRDGAVLDDLARVCGPALLDVHTDADHHRSVFTLAGPGDADAIDAARVLTRRAVECIDLRAHEGVHPRFGVVDVVPFVALDEPLEDAVAAATTFAEWIATDLGVPVFLYADADPARRSLPETRRDAFTRRAPDFGPHAPDARAGATAVGARPPLAAVNCRLDRDDLELARAIARQVRERDGGLPGVRALGLRLASSRAAQVSMNVTALDVTGVETACTAVRTLAEEAGATVAVELVGLVPAAEAARWTEGFRTWSGLDAGAVTIEARLAQPRRR
jgi:glutamate formiminotransferase